MDIISASLAAVISTMSGTITDTYADNANTRLTRQVITHQGQEIHFEHLVWRIRDNSVCNNKRGRISEYSRCTLAARAAFNEICQTHQNKNYTAPKAKNMVSMYCLASRTFKPTIASIQPAFITSDNTKSRSPELVMANQKCAALILESQTSKDPFIQSKKKKACQRYKELSGQ